MNSINAQLANEIVKVLFPVQAKAAVEDAHAGRTSAVRSSVEGILLKVEGVLNTHKRTAFTDVGCLNELIGNKFGECTPEALESQWELIAEEFEELRVEVADYIKGLRALNVGDATVEELFGIGGDKEARATIRKEAVDLHVVTYGLIYRMGADANLDHEIEWASQMSKFYHGDGTGAQVVADEIAERTGLKVEVREPVLGTFAFVSAEDQNDKHGRLYPKGKQLKPHTFVKPQYIA